MRHPLQEELDISLIEKERVEVEIAEKEIFKTELKVIDIFQGVAQILQVLQTYLIRNEVPTRLTARQFQTTYSFISGSLVVYLNGIKEKNITEITDNQFSFPIDTIDEDTIEVSYIKTA